MHPFKGDFKLLNGDLEGTWGVEDGRGGARRGLRRCRRKVTAQ